MGLRGPVPTPRNILALRGSWRAQREDGTPCPEPGIPDPPPWLDGDAKAAWDELAPMLHAMSVLAPVDGQMLALYCRTYARWLATDAFLRKHGDCHVVTGRDGKVSGVRMYPQVKAADRLVDQLVRLGAQFGISPSSRARIRALPPAAEHDPDEERFFGKSRFFAPPASCLPPAKPEGA